MQTSSAGAGDFRNELNPARCRTAFRAASIAQCGSRISFIPIILVLFYRVFLIVMPTQFIKQGSHSFGFRFIISHEKHFPMFGTIRGRIDAKFIHAEITRACPIFGPANPLCLSKIRSGRIGDAIRPRLAGTVCARRSGRRAVSAHPCSVISVCAPR